MITVELNGDDEIQAKFKSIISNTPISTRKAINAAALMVKATAQKSIKLQTAGESYTRYKPTREGLAARPGDAPNDDRGDLVKNIKVSSGTGIRTKEYFALVRSQAPHSKPLEYGTKDMKDMKARPFMKPALAENQAKIREMIARAVRGLL